MSNLFGVLRFRVSGGGCTVWVLGGLRSVPYTEVVQDKRLKLKARSPSLRFGLWSRVVGPNDEIVFAVCRPPLQEPKS